VDGSLCDCLNNYILFIKSVRLNPEDPIPPTLTSFCSSFGASMLMSIEPESDTLEAIEEVPVKENQDTLHMAELFMSGESATIENSGLYQPTYFGAAPCEKDQGGFAPVFDYTD